MEECCVKTILSGQPGLAHMFKALFRNTTGFNCFELLGFDIMLDDMGRPWMIEVNNLPSFETETALDSHIKTQLLRDTLTIVGGDNPARRLFARQKWERAQARIYGDSTHVGQLKKEAIQKAQEERNGYKRRSKEEKAREKLKQRDAEASRKKMMKEAITTEREEMQRARFKYEDENCGNYFRAFPAKDDRYDAFVNAVPSLMAETKTMRLRREEMHRSKAKLRVDTDSQ